MRFVTPDGREGQTTRSVQHSAFNRAEKGDRMLVTYLPDSPDRTAVVSGEHRTGAVIAQVIAQVIGPVSGLASPGILWVAAVRARRHGARETAKVAGIERSSVNVDHAYRDRLTWRGASGRIGASLLYPRADIDTICPGTQIIVCQGLKRAGWSRDVGERPAP